MEQPIIKGKTLTIRVLTLDDAQAHLDCEDSEIAKYLGESQQSTLEGVQSWITTKVIPDWANDGPKFCFAIVENETGHIVGHLEADIDNKADKYFQKGEANISYSLRPESRGKGYVSQAVGLLANWVVDNDIAEIALINVQQDNSKSKAVPERLGFQLERTYKSDKSDNIWMRYTLPFSSLISCG